MKTQQIYTVWLIFFGQHLELVWKLILTFDAFFGGERGLKNSSLQLILYLLAIIWSPWILSFQCVLNPLFSEPILWTPTFQSLYFTKTSDLPVHMLKPIFWAQFCLCWTISCSTFMVFCYEGAFYRSFFSSMIQERKIYFCWHDNLSCLPYCSS